MIRLGVPLIEGSYELLAAGKLDADYLTFYGRHGLAKLREVAAYDKPIFLHDLAATFWLNYADPFDETTMTEGRAMLDLAQSPWFSTGIGASAEPQAHRGWLYREADPENLQSRAVVIDNILRHGRRLQAWASVPLLLENYNYHPTNAYEYICEPDTFSALIDGIGCGVLLDLAHARISAHNMGWPNAQTYLNALPLHKIREVHIIRPGWQGDQMVDAHAPLQEDDFDLLSWVLDRAPVEAVTVELGDGDADTVQRQLEMMRRYLNGRSS